MFIRVLKMEFPILFNYSKTIEQILQKKSKFVFYEKKLCKFAMVFGSIQHSILCPRLSMRTRPAWRSSFIWCEIVDATILRSLPSSPTHAHPSDALSALMLVTVPGVQQVIRRMKSLKRLGFERALNISANFSTFLIWLFDIYRTICRGPLFVKIFFLTSNEITRSSHWLLSFCLTDTLRICPVPTSVCQ